MKQVYLGVKIIVGQPMTRGAYNEYRGWQTPERENAEDEGYLVEYPDSAPNHPDHAGYISWSPKSVFDHSHIALGDVSNFPPFAVRLIGERNQLASNLGKLKTFLEGDVTHLSERNLDLLNRQVQAQEVLLDILNQRLDSVDLGVSVSTSVRVELDLANNNAKDLMGLAIAAGAEGQGPTDVIVALEDAKIVDAEGNEIADSSVEIENLVRGFSVSGNIGENLYGVAVCRERCVANVHSSFVEEGTKLSLLVKIGSHNRAPAFA